MNSYKEVLRLLKDIEQLEASQESMDGGVTKKVSRQIRVKLGCIRNLIPSARKELIRRDDHAKSLYIEKHQQGCLFPELVLVDEVSPLAS